MESIIRNKKKTDELLNIMCGKEAVAEKFKSNLSAKVGSIPKDESDEKTKKIALPNEKDLVVSGERKSVFNSKEKKQFADNINKSVKSYKEEQKQSQNEKVIEDESKSETNNVSLVYNCPLPEDTIIEGRYKLKGKPKQGGFGMTYIATRVGENDGELLVIKELYPYNVQRDVKTGKIQINYNQKEGKELLKNFQKEAARIENLKKEKKNEIKKMNLVITKTNAFEYNDNWYYAMEYVPGYSLADIMFSFKDNAALYNGLPFHYRFQIMDQLCNALENLHKIGCVHQDINPNNIMINFDDENNVNLKVIDYGLATNLYNFGDLSHSCIRYAGTHGFSDVLTQFAAYEAISNEIAQAELAGNTEEMNRLTEKLKLIDIYSCGAVLGYLFLTNINFIKSQNFNVKYELVISDNTLVQPLEIDWNEDNLTIANKLQINLIKKLVSDATTKKLDNRVQSVAEFRTRLHEIMSVDEELIRKMKLMTEIEFWKSNADGITLYVSDFMEQVKKIVVGSTVKEAQNKFDEAVYRFQEVNKIKDSLLHMEIALDSDLDSIVNQIQCINTEYRKVYDCFEEAKIHADITQPSDEVRLEDTGHPIAETTQKEIKSDKKNKTLIDKLQKSFGAILLVAAIIVGGYFVWDNINKEEATSVKSNPSVSEIISSDDTPKSEQMTNDYLNEVFKAAQQMDNDATQKVMEILDDKVLITEKFGDIDSNTHYTKTSFFKVGNKDYVIGETHKISRFVEDKNGKILKIVLEKLN